MNCSQPGWALAQQWAQSWSGGSLSQTEWGADVGCQGQGQSETEEERDRHGESGWCVGCGVADGALGNFCHWPASVAGWPHPLLPHVWLQTVSQLKLVQGPAAPFDVVINP